jgi:hypothetical protein
MSTGSFAEIDGAMVNSTLLRNALSGLPGRTKNLERKALENAASLSVFETYHVFLDLVLKRTDNELKLYSYEIPGCQGACAIAAPSFVRTWISSLSHSGCLTMRRALAQ